MSGVKSGSRLQGEFERKTKKGQGGGTEELSRSRLLMHIPVKKMSALMCLMSLRGLTMAPHSSTLAWKIPWTEGPGRLQSMGLLRVGHD